MQHATYPSLANKRVVITGGGTGIGVAIVDAFAHQGAHVTFLNIAREASLALQESWRTCRSLPFSVIAT